MKRNKDLVEKRRNRIAVFMELKRAEGLPVKVAILEIAEALSIGAVTVKKELAKFNRERVVWV